MHLRNHICLLFILIEYLISPEKKCLKNKVKKTKQFFKKWKQNSISHSFFLIHVNKTKHFFTYQQPIIKRLKLANCYFHKNTNMYLKALYRVLCNLNFWLESYKILRSWYYTTGKKPRHQKGSENKLDPDFFLMNFKLYLI